jgi:hypothetical protein
MRHRLTDPAAIEAAIAGIPFACTGCPSPALAGGLRTNTAGRFEQAPDISSADCPGLAEKADTVCAIRRQCQASSLHRRRRPAGEKPADLPVQQSTTVELIIIQETDKLPFHKALRAGYCNGPVCASLLRLACIVNIQFQSSRPDRAKPDRIRSSQDRGFCPN